MATEVDRNLAKTLQVAKQKPRNFALIAKGANVPAYVVFADATLEAVAARRPRARADLTSLTGIGPVKLERYGEALLQVVRAHEEGAIS